MKPQCLVFFVAVFVQVMLTVFAERIGLTNILQHIREPDISGPESNNSVRSEHMEQRLDNFDPLNNKTWMMKYYRSDDYYVRGGPIFIYVGGEWKIDPHSLRSGHMRDMAESLGGQLFYTEHRFYGTSLPTADASVENFRFLNVEQSLADLAHFIAYIRERHQEYENSQIILVGGSFGATMVTWFRQKYPHLTAGAWASGAPLLLKVEFSEYTEAVGESIRKVNEKCYHRIERAFSQAEKLVEDKEFAVFSKMFKTCEEISDAHPYDIMGLFAMFSRLFAALVESHRPGIIEGACESLLSQTNPTETDVQALARWTVIEIFGANFTYGDCIDVSYENSVAFYRNTSWNSMASHIARRQWNYQLCAEFGWYHTTNSKVQPFGSSVPLEFYIQQCQDVYGKMFSVESIKTNVQRKNTMYGGINPNVSNVYFTYGEFDPWRKVGPTSDLNEFVDIIPDVSHCHDLSSSTPKDNSKMRQVHRRIFNLVKLWNGISGQQSF